MPLQDFARMEREIATVSSGPTKKHSRAFFGCGILCLMFLGVCAWVAWVLAASGLVRVPIFSSLAYEESAPIRVVDSTNAESLERVLERAINTAQSPELSVRLSEASLTASLRAELSTLDQPYFTAAGSQMAVEGESLEVYLPLKTTPQTNNALTARVRLLAQDGGFAAEVSSVRIGGVRLPSVVSHRIVSAILQKGLDKLNDAIAASAVLNTVEYQEGAILLKGLLAL